jgi:protein phosphatase
MSWNPFKKHAEQPGNVPDAAGAEPHDSDRTDPLVTTSAIEERKSSIRQSNRALLDRIELLSGGEVASRFLKIRISDNALAEALRELWLGLPEEQTGFEDLLACDDYPLCARLTCPDLLSLPEVSMLEGTQRAVFRLCDLLAAISDTARLLEAVHAKTGLVWPDPVREGIGLRINRHRVTGLSKPVAQFLGWDLLEPGDESAATLNLFNLLTLGLNSVVRQAESGGFGFGGSCAELIQHRLAAALDPATASYSRLAGLLDEIHTTTQLYGATDVGQRRDHNEDAYLLLDLDQQSLSSSRLTLAAVADGMGGHASGEVASSLTLSLLRQHLLNGLLGPSSRPLDAARLEEQLESAIPAIDRALQERSEMEPELAGMGTTLVGCAMLSAQSTTDPEAVSAASRIFWVGDSRAYLLGSWGIAPLSVDHSHVRDLVDAGSISEEEAREHPMKNVITRCLGGSNSADGTPDVHRFTPGPGEVILLCSDGLSDVLTDEQIWRTAAGVLTLQTGGAGDPRDALQPDLRAIAAALIEAANKGGGPDNITVVLISCGAG